MSARPSPPSRCARFASVIALAAMIASASAGDAPAPTASRPESASWIAAATAQDARRVELAAPAARARAVELARLEADANRPSTPFLALALMVLALPLTVLGTRWLARHPRFRLNRQGLAVSLARDRDRDTAVICLSRPGRKTTSLSRDRNREAAVRAAAAVYAGYDDEEPATNGTTRRIADKHATRQFARHERESRQRTRRAAPLGVIRPRGGLTLAETIIAVAILAFSLCALLGSLGGLDHAHQGNRDLAQVQAVAQAVVERIQGAPWSAFGDPIAVTTSTDDRDVAAANRARILWHRRDPDTTWLRPDSPTPPTTAPVHQPMSDGAADPRDDLRQLGLLSRGSGVPGLQVYVSYAALVGEKGPLWARPRVVGATRERQWREVDEPLYRLPEADAQLRERLSGRETWPTAPSAAPVDAFIATVTVRWRRRDGGPGTYQVATVRRR